MLFLLGWPFCLAVDEGDDDGEGTRKIMIERRRRRMDLKMSTALLYASVL